MVSGAAAPKNRFRVIREGSTDSRPRLPSDRLVKPVGPVPLPPVVLSVCGFDTIVWKTSSEGWERRQDCPLQVLTSAVTSCAGAGRAWAATPMRASIAMSAYRFMWWSPFSILAERLQKPHQAEQGGGHGYQEEGGHQEEDGGDEHLERGEMRSFLCPMTALHPRGIGVNPEGLAERRAELLGLDEGRDHRLDLVGPGSLSERAESLGAGASGPHLQVHPEHVLVERAVPTFGLLGDPGHRGVEPHTGLDADHQHVEHVRQSVDDLALADLDAIVEPEVREE